MTKAEVKILIKFPSGHTEVMTVDEVSALVKDLSKAIGADKVQPVTYPWQVGGGCVYGSWEPKLTIRDNTAAPRFPETQIKCCSPEAARVDVVTRVESEK